MIANNKLGAIPDPQKSAALQLATHLTPPVKTSKIKPGYPPKTKYVNWF
ncbi:hypothetical protein O59_004176 [Cellvibrio sp. BR]|nr:hypothetical protein O59_004176 [Cellvibrio sp. BR]